MKLIIVESPGKIKTIQKYIGKEYHVMASNGHIMNLPKSKLGVDIENNFEPQYQVLKEKKKLLKQLKDAAKQANMVYLAPDPDREGEAIASNLADSLGIDQNSNCRIAFQEITKNALISALKNPGTINHGKVEAQKSRRVLDRLAGYMISPLLWKKLSKGLSAGRVQSVALKLVCDREAEIEKFVPVKYYKIFADYLGKDYEFVAEATKKLGKRYRFEDKKEAEGLVEMLKSQEQEVSKVEYKNKKENPPFPLITSSLQQEANKKFGYSAKRTMMIAQKLYEGIDLGKEGPIALITYMRTDSTRISEEAKSMAKDYINKNFGKEYIGSSSSRKSSKTKFTQDAHEAIRPTYVEREPGQLKKHLTPEQYNIYSLIWKRFVSSQMAPRKYEEVTIELKAGDFQLVSSAIKDTFPGFRAILIKKSEKKMNKFGDIKKGDSLKSKKVNFEEKETQPPPRYNEASLIKALEKEGVGRPSTYAVIMHTIQERKYVLKKEKKFFCSDLGIMVNDVLGKFFKDIVNIKFTALMEETLDKIEAGKTSASSMLSEFYEKLNKDIDTASKKLARQRIKAEEKCPKCGSDIDIIYGKNGRFAACVSYPECKFTRSVPEDVKLLKASIPLEKNKVTVGEYLIKEKESKEPEKVGICPECGNNLIVKRGRFGEFVACTNYPACKYTRKDRELIMCPRLGCEGHLVRKRGKQGKFFYGCSKYPECKYVSPKKPEIPKCDICGESMKLDGEKWVCPKCNANEA